MKFLAFTFLLLFTACGITHSNFNKQKYTKLGKIKTESIPEQNTEIESSESTVFLPENSQNNLLFHQVNLSDKLETDIDTLCKDQYQSEIYLTYEEPKEPEYQRPFDHQFPVEEETPVEVKEKDNTGLIASMMIVLCLFMLCLNFLMNEIFWHDRDKELGVGINNLLILVPSFISLIFLRNKEKTIPMEGAKRSLRFFIWAKIILVMLGLIVTGLGELFLGAAGEAGILISIFAIWQLLTALLFIYFYFKNQKAK